MNKTQVRRQLISKIIQLSVFVEGDTFVISDAMKGTSRQLRYWMDDFMETLSGNQISYKIIKGKCHITLNVTFDAPYDINLCNMTVSEVEQYRPDTLPDDHYGRRIEDLYNSASPNHHPLKRDWHGVPITRVTCASPRISHIFDGHLSLVDIAFNLEKMAKHIPNGPSPLTIKHDVEMRAKELTDD